MIMDIRARFLFLPSTPEGARRFGGPGGAWGKMGDMQGGDVLKRTHLAGMAAATLPGCETFAQLGNRIP